MLFIRRTDRHHLALFEHISQCSLEGAPDVKGVSLQPKLHLGFSLYDVFHDHNENLVSYGIMSTIVLEIAEEELQAPVLFPIPVLQESLILTDPLQFSHTVDSGGE